MADTAVQRKNMVESQVRPSDVTDRRITAAMSAVPRERFVPGELSDVAYLDGALEAGGGAVLLAPRVLARLLQAASIEAGDKVLVIGTAPGYAAAIIARIASEVVALAPNDLGHGASAAAVAELGLLNVSLKTGPLEAGDASGRGPFNVILIEGMIEGVPDALIEQLASGGRLVAVQAEAGVGRAYVLTKNRSGSAARRVLFDAHAPTLSGFRPVGSRFVF